MAEIVLITAANAHLFSSDVCDCDSLSYIVFSIVLFFPTSHSLLFSARSNAYFGANFKITCIVTYEKDEVNILVLSEQKKNERTGRKMRALEVMHIY